MKNEIKIREAVTGDVPAITKLSNQLGYGIDEKATVANLAHIQLTSDEKVYVGVDDNDKVTAWLHVSKRTSLESGVFFEILGLVVDEAYRSRGIGKQLVQQAIQWSRGEGAKVLRVRSNVIRKEAHTFYLQQHFTEKKLQKVFECNL